MESPGAKVTGSCEPSDVDAVNRTLVLCRTVNTLSAELSLQPHVYFWLVLTSCQVFSRKVTNVAC